MCACSCRRVVLAGVAMQSHSLLVPMTAARAASSAACTSHSLPSTRNTQLPLLVLAPSPKSNSHDDAEGVCVSGLGSLATPKDLGRDVQGGAVAHTADVGIVAAHTLAHAKVSHLHEGTQGSTDALAVSRCPSCPCGTLRSAKWPTYLGRAENAAGYKTQTGQGEAEQDNQWLTMMHPH